VLPEFVGTNGVSQTPEQRSRLLAFVAKEYDPTWAKITVIGGGSSVFAGLYGAERAGFAY
jgi:hypothetical protein